jgi:predicted RNA-binding Zn-ribbon protein involved in translation (DUF1610 family)
MEESYTMKQIRTYKKDLTEIKESRDFACPKCGAKISPDDQTETVYSILGSKVNNNCLEEVVICCHKCYSHIHLTGFSLMKKIERL